MKTRTIIELLTLSASLYHIAKDTHLLEKIQEYSEKSKHSINQVAAEPLLDEDGNERGRLSLGQIHYFQDRLVNLSNPLLQDSPISRFSTINHGHVSQVNTLDRRRFHQQQDMQQNLG